MMRIADKSKARFLRRKAVESLKKNQSNSVLPNSGSEILKLLQELEVHQIELEMQNEELVKAKSSAMEAAEKYIELYDFAPSGYLTLSSSGEIHKMNLACSRMLGKERSFLKNKNFAQYVSKDTRDDFNFFLQNVFQSDVNESCEIVLNHSTTSSKYIHLEGHLSDNGEHCFASMVDISVQKKTEAELHKLNAELEKRVTERTVQLTHANNEIESFAYSVSHDLCTPLRHINGFIRILREMRSGNWSEEELKCMNFISEGSSEMGKLIDALLAFSRIGRTELKKTHINTQEIVKTVIMFLEPETHNRKIIFNIEPLQNCKGDERLIKQVWINLISNAIKYTGKKEEAVIKIGNIINEKEIVYFVKDNGIGFRMQYAKKLFGVFQRLHKTSDFEGIGIGLANVNRIITKHKGHCSAEGELNKGATFYFSLPK